MGTHINAERERERFIRIEKRRSYRNNNIKIKIHQQRRPISGEYLAIDS
tara:strand:+ start:444 stop:590 length:147 start_codon:yes stop_codon:yes gene_type:complete